ncbi:MAG TPA: hypothetical protein VII72_12135 [Myxococcota bacterium]
MIDALPKAGRRIAAGAIATALLLAPRVSEACAVCSFRDDGTQRGFLLGTLIMTTLPFLVVGSVIFFVRRRLRSAELRLSRSASSPS